MPSDNNPKTKKIYTLIKAIGGKPNGTGDTWIFTTSQLRKAGLLLILIFTSAIHLASSINTIKDLPGRVNLVENEQHIFQRDLSALKIESKYIKEILSDLKQDIKYIRERTK